MNKTWLLIKTQMQNAYFHKSSGKKGFGGINAGVLGCVVLVGLSLYYSWAFETALDPTGQTLPIMITVMATAIVFFGGITTSQGMLFGFKDFDILMSLPVNERQVVSSKITVYTLMQYMYTAFLVLPAMIIHGVRLSSGFMYYLKLVFGVLFLPLVPMVLAAVLGLMMQRLTAGKRYGKLLQNILTIAFVALVYYVSFTSGMSSSSTPGYNANLYGTLGRYIPTVVWFVDGVTKDGKALFLLAAVGIIVFAAFILLYSRAVIRINAQGNQGYHVKDFRMKKTARSSSFTALLKQELQRYFANFTYFLNTSMGMLILLGMSVYVILIKNPMKDAIIVAMEQGPEYSYIIWELILLIIAALGQMTCTTGVSISLEGKCLWILKSIPVSVRDIFSSKIAVNLMIVMIPSCLSMIFFGIAFHFPPMYFISGIVLLAVCSLFISMNGLLLNLRFPKLDYDREAQAIKQSLSSFLSMMVPLFLMVGVITVTYLTNMQYFYGVIIFYAVLDAILYFALATYGKERFRKLS